MTSQYNWYITGRDAYPFEWVTDWMALPPLPEQTGEAVFTYQYTPESCPGHSCAEQCDHRGLPLRSLITTDRLRSFFRSHNEKIL